MITLENEFLKASFFEHGAELRSLFDKDKNEDLMWNGDKDIWNGVSPVLFPVIGRLWNFEYTYQDKTYDLGLHGFLRDQDFNIYAKDESFITFSFESTESTYKQYPFKHAVQITYTLIDNHLDVTWEVFNKDKKEMHYSIGAHPAFLVNDTDEYVFEFEGNEYITEYFNDQGYLKSSKTIKLQDYPLTNTLFKDDALMFNRVSAITLHNKTQSKKIRVDFNGFDHVAIWAKYYEEKRAPFVCIEPWIGMPDYTHGGTNLKNKFAIKNLAPLFKHEYTYRITVSNKKD